MCSSDEIRARAEHGKEKSGHIEIQALEVWERKEKAEWQNGSYNSCPRSHSPSAPDAPGTRCD